MDTLNVVLKTGYKIVKDFSEPHKPVSLLIASSKTEHMNIKLTFNEILRFIDTYLRETNLV